MGGLPILRWNDLLEAIILSANRPANDEGKAYYKYTWTNFKLPLESGISTKIVALPEGNNYQILINNKSENRVYFYLGEDGEENLKIDNSAWELKPGHGIIIKQTECTLWGISDKNSDIIVTVHSTKPKLNEEVVIALNIDLKIGTGDLLGEDIPLLQFANIYSDWEQILRDTVDSDQGVTGYKLAYLQSFQPSQTYEFTLNVDPAFTDFRNGRVKPIQVFLIDSNLALAAIASAIAGMRGNNSSVLSGFVPSIIGYAKNNGWVANLSPEGGAFSITPGNSQTFLHFSALTGNSSEGCVITNFDKATNTFTLGGY
ncbi:hypothetical protein [Okeania sp. SIO2B3]|uniref:hypothetical protein n=1 Tax=Okeania sp. SIO2B3 TaxID=2607784 RepID=UPI0013C27565|nr:hypothetical protein [Okeania sp. SIO2B3]NET46753.1 hypothetical protein [Okeania sp. SIO2B3]